MKFSQAKQNFYQQINQSDSQIDLALSALYIAQNQFNEINPQQYIHALDAIAAEIKARLPQSRYPLKIIQTINKYLFQELGFIGNYENYYDPLNSYLNQVIKRRTGIPITLSVIYLEIAKRIDFPMVGIGMPGHFLIRPDFEEAGIYVDAFNQGEVLFTEDCEARLSQIYHQPVQLKPEFLAAVSQRQILARILTNLKIIYMNSEQFEIAVSMIEFILLLFPNAITEKRDRGILYYQLKRWIEARQDLEDYLRYSPSGQDASVIRQLLARIASY
ncbi:MAG: transglutaminase-like domain-containing protein [Microcoleaceae cyanobacterium]